MVVTMERPAVGRKRKQQARSDERVTIFALKDFSDYRDWMDGLSNATLIAPATIVRDALAAWAAARGLPPPPSGPGSSPPKKGAKS